MGLDQYLYTNSKKLAQSMNKEQSGEPDYEKDYKAFMRRSGIAVQWRKSNQIHRWFVENVQNGNDDCGTYEVDVEQLIELRDTIGKVLDSTELVEADIQNGYVNGKPNIEKGKKLADPSVAMELLPAQNGVFFGNQDYNQYYWWDLEYTRDKLDELLGQLENGNSSWYYVHKEEPDWQVRFYYHSSW